MLENKTVTIKVPENLVTPTGFSSNYTDKSLIGRKTSLKKFNLIELVYAKGELTDQASEIAKSINSNLTLKFKELTDLILNLKITNHNLNLVKEALAIANTPICQSIYHKSTLEAERVAFTKRKDLIKDEKSLEYKRLASELSEIRNKVKKIKEELPAYNEAVSVTLQFYI